MTFILFLITYYLNQFLKMSANVVIPIFQNELGLSSAVSGLISSLFFLSYGVMQVLSGPLCKKIGPEKLVGSGMIFAAFGVISLGTAKSAFPILLGRFLMGLGLGTIFVSIFFYMTLHYSGKKYVTFSAIALSVSSFGTASSAAPLQFVIREFGITATFIVLSAFTFLVGILLLLSKKSPAFSEEQTDLFKQVVKTTKYILSSKDLVLGMVIWVCFASLQMNYMGLWCTKWTALSFPNKSSFSGLAGTVCGIALMFGSFFGKYVKTAKQTYKQSSLVNMGLLCLSMIAICITNNSGVFFLSLVSNIFFGFLCGTVSLHCTALCRENSSPEENASVVGIWNFISSISTLLTQYFTGVLIDFLAFTKDPFSWTHLILVGLIVLAILSTKKK